MPKLYKYLIKKTMKNAFYTLFLIVIFTSCEWRNEYDVRNYLRNEHPYCEIIQIDLGRLYCYQINDTINDEIWIYTSGHGKGSVKRHKVKK